ncbi:LysR substrate-binding domain-containing protein [Falsiroseomonas sp. HW251]|uniref:LysR substrate-binding domain-containing protein n=1 Tax=Falsiroseomonas sp. HW251 TaxID=3390998 RepID=UPI003D31AAB2
MAVELRHLRYFIAVAEEGHVTRAAERLGMQQPPLSQQIKALEREIGADLFRRRPRGVELTEAGRAFLADARAIIERLGRASETVRRTARGEQGRLSVGLPPTAPFHPFVPYVIRAFRDAYPMVSLTLEESLRTELLDGLQHERIDVAFIRASMTAPEGLTVHPLLEEPMIVALPAMHARARRRRGEEDGLEINDLNSETFIIYARQNGPAFYEETLAACLRAGFTPRMGQEAPRISTALSLVAIGLGIALVPASMRRVTMDGVAYQTLRGSRLPRAFLGLATRRGDPSPVVQNFVALVRRTVRSWDRTT